MDPRPTPSKADYTARPLCQNPHWADIAPIKQDDGEAQGQMAVVPINYPAHYSDVMDMFRGVVQKNELSLRTLYLTEIVIDCNSANYSAWHFRRLCLAAIEGQDLKEELAWVATVAIDTPKNYQLWHHRRCLYEKLGSVASDLCKSELDLTATVLKMDSKNYHAWSHRQWCLKYFTRSLPIIANPVTLASTTTAPTPTPVTSSSATSSSASNERPNAEIIDQELAYIDSLLIEDIRNNSAWNQRFFIRTFPSAASVAAAASISPSTPTQPSFISGMTAEVITSEITYVGGKLLLCPHNESSWNYLEGLMKQQAFEHHAAILELMKDLNEYPTVEEIPGDDEYLRLSHFPNRFAQSLCVELYDSLHQFDRGAAAADFLAHQLDPIRKKYWEFRAEELKKKKAVAAQTTATKEESKES